MAATVRTSYPEQGMVMVQWPSIVNADSNGDPAQLGRYSCKSVQVSGTFGSSGEITIEGSNDGVTYHTLVDPAGGSDGQDIPLVFTSGGIRDISPNTRFIRPKKSASDAALDIAVTII